MKQREQILGLTLGLLALCSAVAFGVAVTVGDGGPEPPRALANSSELRSRLTESGRNGARERPATRGEQPIRAGADATETVAVSPPQADQTTTTTTTATAASDDDGYEPYDDDSDEDDDLYEDDDDFEDDESGHDSDGEYEDD